MFNREWYDALRDKNEATSVSSVDETAKIDVAAEKNAAERAGLNSVLTIWPISGFYDIKKVIESRTYLQARNASWKASITDRLGMARK